MVYVYIYAVHLYIMVIAVYRGIYLWQFRYYSGYGLRCLLITILFYPSELPSVLPRNTFRVCCICRSFKGYFGNRNLRPFLVSRKKTFFVTDIV